jgi:hypothetical protein
VVPKECKNPKDLRQALEEETQREDADKCHLRLFVVEDLSRDVIELLGAHLDIEPAFFREHIVDYAWYNTRDRWVDPPNLNMVAGRNRWVSIRFVTARYFETTESFKEGYNQAVKFNVLRRPDDDQNNKSVWDDREAIVGITRTRASIWVGSRKNQKTGEGQETGEGQKKECQADESQKADKGQTDEGQTREKSQTDQSQTSDMVGKFYTL